MSIQPPPTGFRQHPRWPELAANAAGDVIRWHLRLQPRRWTPTGRAIDRDGYHQVRLPDDGATAQCHHIVYECAHGRTFPWSSKSGGGLTVNHINGIKTDNRIENLEAIPHAENIRLAHCIHGLPRFVKRQRNGYQIAACANGRQHNGGSFKTVALAQAALPAFLARIGHHAATAYAQESA